jgi:hypothetical protein
MRGRMGGGGEAGEFGGWSSKFKTNSRWQMADSRWQIGWAGVWSVIRVEVFLVFLFFMEVVCGGAGDGGGCGGGWG